MYNWYDIVEPHQDIREGGFDESVFAAKLWDAVLGTAPANYSDPYLFFKKTYLTDGLKNLLLKVNNKLKNGKGASVIEIKTEFGGGKTHALISIYHYLMNGERIKSQLPEGCDLIDAGVAVIVGTELDPVNGHERDGLTIRTLWGEIAYQLGGVEGYHELEDSDRLRVSPGKEKLKNFLKQYEPFVLLIDEALIYIAKAQGVEFAESTLGSQAFAFLQELTETVSSLKKGMLLVTLPSSHLEDYTKESSESLARLDKIFGRIESFETPVKGEEIYSIITRRLFSQTIDQERRDQVVHQYYELYQKHRDELPAKVKESDYLRRMELAYPFHPEMIDVLNEKWSTFSSFQRTRGVLRLLANVVEDLYRKEKNIDLILPSDIGLDAPSLRQEFLHHIGNEYEGIIGSDISGHDAKSLLLDRENKGWKHLAERISTAIFMYSFSADRSERGATLEYIKLTTLHAETIPSMVTEVLQRLDKTLWYLNEKGGMYHFSKIPNLNRMILDKKERYNESYEEEMRSILQKEAGKGFRAYLWTRGSEDVPDNRELKLVILHPNADVGTPSRWLDKRGNTFRTYKNTIIFAMADPAGFGHLKEQIKEYLALNEIKEGIDSGAEETLKDRLPEVNQRIIRIKDDFSYNARRMYNTLVVGAERISLGQPTVGKEGLSTWYMRELETRERIVKNLHYRFLVNRFLRDKEWIETGLIVDQFCKDTRLPIPASLDVIKRMIKSGVTDGAFGIGFVEDEEVEADSIKTESCEITFGESEVIVSKALVQRILSEREKKEEETTEGKDKKPKPGGGELPVSITPPKPPEKPSETVRKFKKIRLRVENIPSTKITEISRGVLMPISQEVGVFELTLEINIDDEEGVSASTIQNKVKETIQQIGAKIVREKIE
ncbi:MAG: ATP-binding protein [Candidatus Syntropharchaeales archaeon]